MDLNWALLLKNMQELTSIRPSKEQEIISFSPECQQILQVPGYVSMKHQQQF